MKKLLAAILAALFLLTNIGTTLAVTVKDYSEKEISRKEQLLIREGYETKRIQVNTKATRTGDPCHDQLGDGWRVVFCWFSGCLCYRHSKSK
ncbi:hypothetical protein [Thermosulfidibacter takaii]|uniref:hypothetical protein n=1 Tax=Thermosulfidibacter takaii TaxID=412593 RepID=UPI00083811C0|nr:hypothetical protein [Thermosulfidibacter takaii]